MISKILVTGGCGYIGSAVVAELIAAGSEVVVLDNLSRGHIESLHPSAAFVQADIGDAAALRQLFKTHKIDGIIHLAGYIQVEESVCDPKLYIENNVEKAKILANEALSAGIKLFVFSSSAAVYGQQDEVPIKESAELEPVNPYGKSKLDFEKFLLEQKERGLKYAALRYFNAAGATEFSIEGHNPETHLIPLALAAAAGERGSIEIFGSDYSTPDGTNIRDYVHVKDIAMAHLLILEKLRQQTNIGASISDNAYNIAVGSGFSVKQVLAQVQEITGEKLEIKIAPRRAGDPAVLIADPAKLKSLGWKPDNSDLKNIISSAWHWKNKNKYGIMRA